MLSYAFAWKTRRNRLGISNRGDLRFGWSHVRHTWCGKKRKSLHEEPILMLPYRASSGCKGQSDEKAESYLYNGK